MDFLRDTWKQIKGIPKPLEGFKKSVVIESSYFMLGIALEGGKGLGWKGALFVWPFLVAFVIACYLIVSALWIG